MDVTKPWGPYGSNSQNDRAVCIDLRSASVLTPDGQRANNDFHFDV